MPQLSLPLTLPESFSEDSFIISDCNREAYDTVLVQKNWLGHALYLYGEKASGKSHLAYIWRMGTGAQEMAASAIDPERVTGNVVVENIEYATDAQALFHLFNHVKDIGAKLLLTSALPPSSLPFTLPDLTSRLRACQLATINPPDDALLAGVMQKQFSDRQLAVDAEVLAYLVPRMERTLAGVKNLVETIDQSALAEQKSITIPFVKRVLEF